MVYTSDLPRQFNAADYFIGRHAEAGYGAKSAFVDDQGTFSYDDLIARVSRAANGLLGLGLPPESRVAMVMFDSIEFPAAFWGAIKAGLIPVPINTLLTAEHYAYILGDCRAQALLVSEPLLDGMGTALQGQPFLKHLIVVRGIEDEDCQFNALLDGASANHDTAPTTADDVAAWLYSSGSTGDPKGVKHLHRNFVCTAETYGRQVLGIRHDDVVYSAAKLFFAYGLGNAMTFPLSVGATAILSSARPTPAGVLTLLEQHQPSIYFGVPTLYAAILADAENEQRRGSDKLRLCVSAGEALPADTAERWQRRFGVPIIDGVGSTEMLHIFLSNAPDDVNYGTAGRPVPGYETRLVDEAGHPVGRGEIGELVVAGGSSAEGYWNQRDKSLATFVGNWTYTGDKYFQDERGYFHFCGRTDDMFKCGGNWVSPFDVEAVLITHDAVLEAAVVAHADENGNEKPKAFVVLKDGAGASDALAEELKQHVKSRLELWKYPRWIQFTEALPKTATGKIQRFKLRNG